MDIAILIYDRLTALDAVGPYEVLSRMPDARVTFVAEQPGPKRTDTGALALIADATLEQHPAPDVLLVPGGPGQEALMDDGPLHEWLRAAHERTTWTTSVCTGSLILAAAGLLDGVRATTHWAAIEHLAALGAQPVSERVVFDGKIATAAGVSAGIDMALALAARIAGPQLAQAIQLGIEYDPQPPFDCGSPAKAPAEIVAAVRAVAASRRPARGDGSLA
jgi:transcriptional regulator GlxA family with amidase domain